MQHYDVQIEWIGNKGSGTFDYRSYERTHQISVNGKPIIMGSSDSIFLGESDKHNPQDLFVASIASCHMLWYLHLCSREEIIVMSYTDKATGEMILHPDGSGSFSRILLCPEVTVSRDQMLKRAGEIHDEARAKCYLANSCNFEIVHNPMTKVLQ